MNSQNTILIRGGIAFDKRPTPFISQTVINMRKWFDGELVICTWKGQEKHLEGLDKLIDKVILVDDPGLGFIQSFNRQLVSYEEGLKYCSGNLVLVCRADFDLQKDPFPLWHSVPTTNNGMMKVFENRVIVGNMMTIHPQKTDPRTAFFRVSDWLQIGKKSDLEKWASILNTSKALYKQATGLHTIDTQEYKTESFGSEQVWFIGLLHKYLSKEINLQNYANFPIEMAWAAIVNNFYVANTRSTLGAYNLNWDFQPEFHPWYMTEDEYKIAYNAFYGKQ